MHRGPTRCLCIDRLGGLDQQPAQSIVGRAFVRVTLLPRQFHHLAQFHPYAACSFNQGIGKLWALYPLARRRIVLNPFELAHLPAEGFAIEQQHAPTAVEQLDGARREERLDEFRLLVRGSISLNKRLDRMRHRLGWLEGPYEERNG